MGKILIYGCLLCKKNLPHSHEEEKPTKLINGGVFTHARAKIILEDIRKLFFPTYKGRWITFKKID